MKAKALPMRGHHLLCVLGFRGLGYSEEFIRNMQAVVRRLHNQPQVVLKLETGCDVICRACPYRWGEWCARRPNASNPEATDRAVLARLGYSPGQRVRAVRVFRRVAERILPQDINKLCPDCEWRVLGSCAAGLRALRKCHGPYGAKSAWSGAQSICLGKRGVTALPPRRLSDG